ncbi:Pycsar system effector family protein [Streptomyces andamanensis]|uniref:Pycsar system effector family protein n=1 Tax=Streptomyces andamanensis TaxID=1565035 RepID=A0ABV8TNF5_9ACTN
MAVESTKTAWRIQAAVADGMAKADSKASFALTMQSAALAVLVLLATSARAVGDLDAAAPKALSWRGILRMTGGVSCAARASSPNLGNERQGPEGEGDFLCFGHVRRLDPAVLEAALRGNDPLLSPSRHMVMTSEIAWTKHRRVQWLLPLAAAGRAAFGLAMVVG